MKLSDDTMILFSQILSYYFLKIEVEPRTLSYAVAKDHRASFQTKLKLSIQIGMENIGQSHKKC